MFWLQENIFIKSEDDMVKLFIEIFSDTKASYVYDFNRVPKFYEQIRVKEIGRISDLIIISEPLGDGNINVKK